MTPPPRLVPDRPSAVAIGNAFLSYFRPDGFAMYPSSGSELFREVLERAREIDAAPIVEDDLPGMWATADFMGGAPDEVRPPAAPPESGYAKGLRDSGQCPCSAPAAPAPDTAGEADILHAGRLKALQRGLSLAREWSCNGYTAEARRLGDKMREALSSQDGDYEAPPPRVTGGRADEVRAMAKWIVKRGQDLPDHACALCVPNSDMLISGFKCAYHRALDYMPVAQAATGGEG